MSLYEVITEKHSSSKIDIAAWNPKFDLLAIATAKGDLILQRLFWRKAWSVSSLSETTRIVALAWAQNGRWLSVAYSSGVVRLYEIESGDIIVEWNVEDDVRTLPAMTSCEPMLVTHMMWSTEHTTPNTSAAGDASLRNDFQDYVADASPSLFVPRPEQRTTQLDTSGRTKDKGSLSGSSAVIEDNISNLKQPMDLLWIGTSSNLVLCYAYGFLLISTIQCEHVPTLVPHTFCHSGYFKRFIVLHATNNGSSETTPCDSVTYSLYDTTTLAQNSFKIRLLALHIERIRKCSTRIDKTTRAIRDAWEDTMITLDNKFSIYAKPIRSASLLYIMLLDQHAIPEDSLDREEFYTTEEQFYLTMHTKSGEEVVRDLIRWAAVRAACLIERLGAFVRTHYAELWMERGDGLTVGDQILETLGMGHSCDKFKQFILYGIGGEKGVKTMSGSVEHVYKTISELLAGDLRRATHALYRHINALERHVVSDQISLDETQSSAPLTMDPDSLATLKAAVEALTLKVNEMEHRLEENLRIILRFFEWLKIVISLIKVNALPAPGTTDQKMEFTSKDLDFIRETFMKPWRDVKGPLFRLDKIGQYLNNAPLDHPLETKSPVAPTNTPEYKVLSLVQAVAQTKSASLTFQNLDGMHRLIRHQHLISVKAPDCTISHLSVCHMEAVHDSPPALDPTAPPENQDDHFSVLALERSSQQSCPSTSVGHLWSVATDSGSLINNIQFVHGSGAILDVARYSTRGICILFQMAPDASALRPTLSLNPPLEYFLAMVEYLKLIDGLDDKNKTTPNEALPVQVKTKINPEDLQAVPNATPRWIETSGSRGVGIILYQCQQHLRLINFEDTASENGGDRTSLAEKEEKLE